MGLVELGCEYTREAFGYLRECVRCVSVVRVAAPAAAGWRGARE